MSNGFNYGGQAVIEGVMMRGARRMAVAVRQPNGEISVRTEALNPRIYNSRLNQIPLLRGITLLWDALGLGLGALIYPANIAISEQEQRFEGPLLWGLMALAILLALGLFFVAPLLIIGLIALCLAWHAPFGLAHPLPHDPDSRHRRFGLRVSSL